YSRAIMNQIRMHRTTPAVISLAVLKVNWDQQGRDYLSNFLPFVVDALKFSKETVVSLPAIGDYLRSHYRLEIPAGALQLILKRAAKAGFVRRASGVYEADPEKCATSDLEKQIKDIERDAR